MRRLNPDPDPLYVFLSLFRCAASPAFFFSVFLTTRRHCLRIEAMAPSSLRPAVLLLSSCLLLFLLPLCTPESQKEEEPNISPTVLESYDNSLSTNATSSRCGKAVTCQPGIILPVWKPDDPGLGNKIARAAVYFISLMYMFLGVSIIADRFMASIEVITSQVNNPLNKKYSYVIGHGIQSQTNSAKSITLLSGPVWENTSRF